MFYCGRKEVKERKRKLLFYSLHSICLVSDSLNLSQFSLFTRGKVAVIIRKGIERKKRERKKEKKREKPL